MSNITYSYDTLVVGATGFIGNHMMHTLLEAGKSVRVLVRRGKKSEALKGLPIDIHYGYLEDRDSVVSAANGVERIYCCAGLSSDWDEKKNFFAANTTGAKNLLDALEVSKAKRLVHISTSDVYGYPKVACSEEAEIKDVGLPYNRSKVEGERIIWKEVKERNLPVTVFRPASVYGPRSMEWVVEISRLMLGKEMVLLSGGTSRAGLIYVENLTRLMMMAAESPAAIGKCYNARDTSNETWKDYVEGLGKCFVDGSWKATKVPASLAYGIGYISELIWGALRIKSRPVLTRHAVLLLSRDQGYDMTRAQQDLGFESWISFEEGMERTREWMRSEEGRSYILDDVKFTSDAYA